METASASHNHATTEENHTSGYPTSHALLNLEEAQPETTKFSDSDPIAERSDSRTVNVHRGRSCL
ncbi:hypothetical protein DY000_02051720 [Brassica cretica]|uniref:Uncharacterized protein n=1 Tax=Brassica cretica TaxID=69181 RepID=A0ABQ7EYD7_BRACR|nr:hypothetical protein DY000_02051720 [Brassica cretica]